MIMRSDYIGRRVVPGRDEATFDIPDETKIQYRVEGAWRRVMNRHTHKPATYAELRESGDWTRLMEVFDVLDVDVRLVCPVILGPEFIDASMSASELAEVE